MADNPNTFMSAWGYQNYREQQVLFVGSVQDLTKIALPGGGTANDWMQSLATGPSTWVACYRDADWDGGWSSGTDGTCIVSPGAIYIGPNTAIPDLEAFYDGEGNLVNKTISSIWMWREEPAGWPGATADTQPLNSGDGTKPTPILTDLSSGSPNKVLKAILGGLVAPIPGLGAFVKVLLNVAWSMQKPSDDDVWRAMQRWVVNLTYDFGIAWAAAVDQNGIAGIFNLLAKIERECDAGQTEIAKLDFNFLIDTLLAVSLPRFTNVSSKAAAANAAGTLDYISVFGTLALGILRANYLYCKEIYGSDAMKEMNLDLLRSQITALRRAVAIGVEAAKELRRSRIEIIKSGGQMPIDYHTAWQGHPEDSTDHAQLSVDYYIENYVDPTSDALFDPYLEIADLWTYFDLDNVSAKPNASPVATAPKQVKMGAWGGNNVYFNQMDKQGFAFASFDVKAPSPSRVTGLTLHGAGGLEIAIDGAAPTKIGHTASGGPVFAQPKDGAITAAFGTWESHLVSGTSGFESIVLRGNYAADDGRGTAAYDRGCFLDGKAGEGGLYFFANGPDGSDSVLSGVFGFTTGGTISALGFYWTYLRAQMRTGYREWTPLKKA